MNGSLSPAACLALRYFFLVALTTAPDTHKKPINTITPIIAKMTIWLLTFRLGAILVARMTLLAQYPRLIQSKRTMSDRSLRMSYFELIPAPTKAKARRRDTSQCSFRAWESSIKLVHKRTVRRIERVSDCNVLVTKNGRSSSKYGEPSTFSSHDSHELSRDFIILPRTGICSNICTSDNLRDPLLASIHKQRFPFGATDDLQASDLGSFDLAAKGFWSRVLLT